VSAISHSRPGRAELLAFRTACHQPNARLHRNGKSVAVACGNTFLLKPAEKAPLTGTRLGHPQGQPAGSADSGFRSDRVHPEKSGHLPVGAEKVRGVWCRGGREGRNRDVHRNQANASVGHRDEHS
jgi:hypothetical protein